MFLDQEEDDQEERKNNQIEETERKSLTCPVCDEEFQDMRGLTSHARHLHELDKKELFEVLDKNETSDNFAWKLLGGLGTILLAIFTAKKS